MLDSSIVLVTGGAGFIGSHVAESFARDHRVIICDNLSRAKTFGGYVDQQFVLSYLRRAYPKMRISNADIRDSRALLEIATGAEVIIHTAGQVAVTTSLKDPRTDFETNVLGTFNVLEAARLNDSAVVFCSTNKVYGENVNKISVIERSQRYAFEDPLYSHGISEDFSIDRAGHSPYGASKLAADCYVQDYAHTYGLKTGVFRMSCIYGERQFGVEDQGWLAWFVIATLLGKPLTIYGDGKQVRDVLYVKDLVSAFQQFLRRNIPHEVFNMGGGSMNTLSLLELLDILRKTTGTSTQVSFRGWRPADQKVYISDIRKAEEMLGWKPRTSPQEGVQRVIEWVKRYSPMLS